MTEEVPSAPAAPSMFPAFLLPLLGGLTLPKMTGLVDAVARRIPWWLWLVGGGAAMHFWMKRKKKV